MCWFGLDAKNAPHHHDKEIWKSFHPATFFIVQFVNYTVNQDFNIVSSFLFSFRPFLYSISLSIFFLRLCRTRLESLICTNFCLLFGFYDRKMNIFFFISFFFWLVEGFSWTRKIETRNKLFCHCIRLAVLKSHRCTHLTHINESLASLCFNLYISEFRQTERRPHARDSLTGI